MTLSNTGLTEGIDVIICSVCGGTGFAERSILWDKLVSEWQLATHERTYIDRQRAPGAPLALESALDRARRRYSHSCWHPSTLTEFATTPEARDLAVPEINEAGNLSPVLRQLSGYVLAA